MNCKQAGILVGGKLDKMMDVSRRVYSTETIAPTLHTCGGGNLEAKIMEEPRLVGGFGEKKSNGGTQYYQQDRVYDGDDIAMCHLASITGGSYNYQVDCRVRKLTEKECFRLQGVRDEDFERVKKNQSKSSLYHLAGDSITTSVLMGLFGEMLGIDWRSKVDDLAEDLSKERNIKNDTY